ncbi:MAG TPA: DUF302 domain-containing protein [Bryobacteraceae bacterium]|nr:DUF302 domain-containing protein [Bryobacteraceae bacterium]
MLQVTANVPLGSVEAALRRASSHHAAAIVTSTHVGHHVPAPGAAHEAIVFSVCHPEIYGALLQADVRMSAFLPCRIAAHPAAGGVVLITLPPSEFCRILERPDLVSLTAPLEALLAAILEDAARPQASSAHATAAGRGSLGATEDQVNFRGLVPQRIDCRGTKVEDLAGTGKTDTQGG